MTQIPQDEGEQLVMRARELARSCHAGQCDKLDIDYFHHLKDVATRVASMPGANAEMIAAAWLHDAVEDDRASMGEVLTSTSAEVARLVSILTRPGYISYARYVARVALEPAASRIKLADLCHNRGKAHLLEDHVARASLSWRYDRAIAAILEMNPTFAGYAEVIDLVPTPEGWVAATR